MATYKSLSNFFIREKKEATEKSPLLDSVVIHIPTPPAIITKKEFFKHHKWIVNKIQKLSNEKTEEIKELQLALKKIERNIALIKRGIWLERLKTEDQRLMGIITAALLMMSTVFFIMSEYFGRVEHDTRGSTFTGWMSATFLLLIPFFYIMMIAAKNPETIFYNNLNNNSQNETKANIMFLLSSRNFNQNMLSLIQEIDRSVLNATLVKFLENHQKLANLLNAKIKVFEQSYLKSEEIAAFMQGARDPQAKNFNFFREADDDLVAEIFDYVNSPPSRLIP